jgi:hypothetical protein
MPRILPDQKRGENYFDPKSKSSYNAPSAYLKDLIGCGDKDYASSSFSAAISLRENCSTPKPAVTFSASTLTKVADKGVLLPAAVVGELAPDLIRWMWQTTDRTAIVVPDTFGTPEVFISPALTGESFERRGSEYVADGKRNGLDTIRASVPIAVPRYDICGLLVGWNISTSISVNKIDPVECIPYLAETTSVSVFIDNSVDLTEAGGSANLAAMVNDLLLFENIFTGAVTDLAQFRQETSSRFVGNMTAANLTGIIFGVV